MASAQMLNLKVGAAAAHYGISNEFPIVFEKMHEEKIFFWNSRLVD